MKLKDDWNAFVAKDVVVEPTHEGSLKGKSFAVKDVFHIKGYTCGAGNPDWLRTHGPADRHADVIDLLLRNGARLTGTTHTDELMFSLNGENEHYGTPVNPKAPQRIPGGSSSGSAVSVSAGLVDFALGTDTGGSVRVPSSYCGIYGFRPTHGVISMDGVIPLAPSFDTVGWMANDAETLLEAGLALLREVLPAVHGFRRVILCRDAWELADSECRQVLLPFASSLADRVGPDQCLDIALEGLAEWMNVFRIIQGLEIWRSHGEWIQREKPGFGSGIAERFAWTGTLKESECQKELQRRDEIRKRLTALLGDDGILILPTTPGIAPLLNMPGQELEYRRTRTLQMTCIAGLSGLPQLTMPLSTVGGCPVGLSVIAGAGQDHKLLLLAKEWTENKESGESYVSKV